MIRQLRPQGLILKVTQAATARGCVVASRGLNKVSANSWYKPRSYEKSYAYVEVGINGLPLDIPRGKRLIKLPGSLHFVAV
jgi:hypothetical protein